MFKGNPGFAKRQKEIARKERQKEKAQRRAAKDAKKKADGSDGVDPDIAGIVPGPQPIIGADGLPIEPTPDADSDDDDADDDDADDAEAGAGTAVKA
jgi:hypothetical protein